MGSRALLARPTRGEQRRTIMAPKAPKDGKKPAPKKIAGEKKGDAGAETAPVAAVQKARKVQKKVVKGVHGTRVKKVMTSVKFYRPQTFRPARAPKYPRKSTPSRVCHEEDRGQQHA